MLPQHRYPWAAVSRLPSVALWLIVAILLLAAALRFYRLDYQSYWNDEGNSRVLASRDIPTLLRNTAADIHPPGYYLALKAWRGLFGESEFALRSFSALAGVVLAAALYRLGRDWLGAGVGLGAALLGAVNPFLIYYSQEARMYSALAALSVASFLLLGRLRRLGVRDWRKRRWWGLVSGYSLVTALGLYTHYAFGFVVVAQIVIVGLRWVFSYKSPVPSPQPPVSNHQPLIPNFVPWLLAQALAFLAFLPWLPTALRQLTSWPAAREAHPPLESLLDLARYLAFGRTLPTGEALPGLAAVGVLLLLGVWLSTGSWRLNDQRALTAWLWLLVPAALTLLFGLLTETFSKFLVVAAPALCLLLAAAGLGFGRSNEKPASLQSPVSGLQWLSVVLRLSSVVVLGYTTALSLNNLYFNLAYFRDDYRGIAAYLARIARPGDAVITDAPNQAEAFAYYHRPEAGAAPLFPLPEARPLDPARTTAQLQDLAARFDRIFVLYWGDAQADPERVIESWLNANTFKAGDQWFGQVRLATYAAARPASQPTTTTQARFGDHIWLDGYTLSASALAPGDIAQLTLFWRTDAPLAERYKVFVHLYETVDAPPIAQQDGEPGGGLTLTSLWQPGQRIADNHGLLIPPDLAPGDYELMLGLYNLADGTRLPIAVGATILGDRLDLGAIHIR